MLLSVVVDMELVHLEVVELWACVNNGGRVEDGGLCEIDRLMLSNLATCVKLFV